MSLLRLYEVSVFWGVFLKKQHCFDINQPFNKTSCLEFLSFILCSDEEFAQLNFGAPRGAQVVEYLRPTTVLVLVLLDSTTPVLS